MREFESYREYADWFAAEHTKAELAEMYHTLVSMYSFFLNMLVVGWEDGDLDTRMQVVADHGLAWLEELDDEYQILQFIGDINDDEDRYQELLVERKQPRTKEEARAQLMEAQQKGIDVRLLRSERLRKRETLES